MNSGIPTRSFLLSGGDSRNVNTGERNMEKFPVLFSQPTEK
jgi:hypothetical protein